jgi:hypothetical protein
MAATVVSFGSAHVEVLVPAVAEVWAMHRRAPFTDH